MKKQPLVPDANTQRHVDLIVSAISCSSGGRAALLQLQCKLAVRGAQIVLRKIKEGRS